MSKNEGILSWMKRWWIKAAWIVAVVAGIVAAIARHGHSDSPAGPSASLTDSLMTIDGTGLQRVDYEGFRVYYNAQWHLPAFVAYELTREETRGNQPRSGQWAIDDSVAGCATSQDYVHSGYDRGHMAPAGDLKWSPDAMKHSFMMTNACPQANVLNGGGWNRLEDKVREWVERDSALIVISGPVVTANDTLHIGQSRVKVPGAFYKIILNHHTRPMRAVAFVYPNTACDGHLDQYATTVREIERLTGLDFFGVLPRDDQERIETVCNINYWIN